MKTLYLKSMLILCALLALGCNKEEPSDDDGQEPTSPVEILTTANGQLKDVTVGTDGVWYAQIDQDWCQLSRMSGENQQQVQVNTVYNRTAEKRTATVSIYPGSPAPAGLGYTLSNAAPAQTFTVTQEANANTQAVTHFTDAKLENGKVFFKLWTGSGGSVADVDGSCLRYYSDSDRFIDNTFAGTPNVETGWRSFGKVVFADNNWGKIQVGGQSTLNTIRVEQSHTLKKMSDSPMQGSSAVHFILNGKLYYGGGFKSAEWFNSTLEGERYSEEACHDFYCFDPQTQTNKKLNNIAGSSGWALVYNGTPYVLLTGDNSFLRYNVSADSWEFIDWIATGEKTVAFYEAGGNMYIVGVRNRYICDLSEPRPDVRNPEPHGISMENVRTVKDADGNVWLSSGNVIYKHNSSGYTPVDTIGNGYMLGAHNGELYIHSTGDGANLKKIDKNGNRHNLDLFFYINESIGNNRYSTPYKYALNINGILYIFGGSFQGYSSNINYKNWSYSGNMFRLNAAAYTPASLMVVTD